MDEDSSLGSIILLLGLFGLWIVAFTNIFITAGFQLTTFLLSLFLGIYIFMQFGLVFLSFRKSSFRWADGTNGVVVRGPETLDDDRTVYWVSVFNEFVPKNKRRKSGGFGWIKDFSCATSTVKVVDKPDMFRGMPRENCNDPNGVVLYHGSIADLPLFDEFEDLKERIVFHRDKVAKYHTMMRDIQNQANLMAQNQNKEIAETAQTISSILRGIDSRESMIKEVNTGGIQK
jgi:hypothetical protein